MSERSYQAIIGVLVIIVLVETGFLIARSSNGSPSMNGAGEATTTTMQQSATTSSSTGMSASTSTMSNPTQISTADSVTVPNQSAGMSVMVSSLTIGQPTWVAIRNSSGITLGAAIFNAGTQTDVSVPLLQATVAGQAYQVLLYADNGNRQFNLNTEILIENADGSVAGTNFSAQ